MTIAARKRSVEDLALERGARELLEAAERQIAALRDCSSVEGTTIAGPCGACLTCLQNARAFAHARATRAEQKLAALHEAIRSERLVRPGAENETVGNVLSDALSRVCVAFEDAESISNQHDCEVEAKVLRRMADAANSWEILEGAGTVAASDDVMLTCIKQWLHKKADLIERGEL